MLACSARSGPAGCPGRQHHHRRRGDRRDGLRARGRRRVAGRGPPRRCSSCSNMRPRRRSIGLPRTAPPEVLAEVGRCTDGETMPPMRSPKRKRLRRQWSYSPDRAAGEIGRAQQIERIETDALIVAQSVFEIRQRGLDREYRAPFGVKTRLQRFQARQRRGPATTSDTARRYRPRPSRRLARSSPLRPAVSRPVSAIDRAH